MINFQYSLIKVCHRAGREYYHVYPEEPIGFFPKDFKELIVKISNPEFYVISFPDCNVTIFKSGRMLIEDLPENSEDRAHAIVNEIMAEWQ